MESGKKEETNKSTVIRQNRERRDESQPTRIFSAIVVLECDPISAKRVNFPTTRASGKYFTIRRALDITTRSVLLVCLLFCLLFCLFPRQSRARGDLGNRRYPKLVCRLSSCRSQHLNHEFRKKKRKKKEKEIISFPPGNAMSSLGYARRTRGLSFSRQMT